jgi:hypothetical protein
MGPLLFIIYINDLPNASNIFKMLMYADDTTIYFNLNDINTDRAETIINNELTKISDWLAVNKLSLNMSKTKCMMFQSKRKQVRKPVIVMNGTTIDYVDSFNFLGLTLNHTLTWKNHIEVISVKISKTIGILNKLKQYFPTSILQTIYNTLLVPHFHYCLLTWGTDTHKIHVLQKKALRIISCSNYISHTEPICKRLNVLKISDLYKLRILKLYYDLANKQLPEYFAKVQPTFSNGNDL